MSRPIWISGEEIDTLERAAEKAQEEAAKKRVQLDANTANPTPWKVVVEADRDRLRGMVERVKATRP